MKRGAALILALIVLALVGSYLASAGVRAYGMQAEQKRLMTRNRLRLALWDAAWKRLQIAQREPDRVMESTVREAPDGVKTSLRVERVAAEKRGEPVRLAVSIAAELEKERQEAWTLVQRDGNNFRILTWVER